MKKKTDATTVDARTGTVQCVPEAELRRIRGGAGNAAIDFGIKRPTG